MENKKNYPSLTVATSPRADYLNSPQGDGDVFFDYTKSAKELQRIRSIELGRPSIVRDTPVEGGVYWGDYGGEAIVVDGEKYPEGIDEAMERMDRLIRRPDGQIDKTLVMRATLDTVRGMMRYDEQAVKDILSRYGGEDFTKISLNTYIREGVGVCRHQALFTAQILERLKKQGVIQGSVSVDRNMVRSGDKYEGHAWVRYTNSGGEVFIIDTVDGIVDTLSNLIRQSDTNPDVWRYARPDDREKLRAKQAGAAVKVIEDAEKWGGPTSGKRS